ncbi:hypothetical protein BLNAU_19738 [Blattamonas nauphoetae]|uniref:Uncharacterized protein n=1 Tax=Blattamonas nauphoetae TaxID=2049346 RepID=A0ABQ9X0R0_9EUKA|nr:hypothetical protein BLNAU_19738 [Blattamonas nauphoetae]
MTRQNVLHLNINAQNVGRGSDEMFLLFRLDPTADSHAIGKHIAEKREKPRDDLRLASNLDSSDEMGNNTSTGSSFDFPVSESHKIPTLVWIDRTDCILTSDNIEPNYEVMMQKRLFTSSHNSTHTVFSREYRSNSTDEEEHKHWICLQV